MSKYESYSSIGIEGKFILCFNITSNDDLTKHDVYLYGKVISPFDEFSAGDIGKNIQNEMYNQITPNSNLSHDNYCNIVDAIVRNEGVRVMKLI